MAYPRGVARWETRAYAFLAFLHHSKPIRRYLCTTNQLERVSKEINRRTKGVKFFPGEETEEKLLTPLAEEEKCR